eukprot:1873963-Amphidinium_carterae.1
MLRSETDDLSKELGALKLELASTTRDVAELRKDHSNLRAAAQDVVAELSALKERVEETQVQSKRTHAMAVEGAKEAVSERLSQLDIDMDATISRLASVTCKLDATVKDAVSSAMQNGPEKELER